MTAAQRTLPIDEALQEAAAHHRSGHLDQAEALYLAILAAQPAQPDANHNLGVIHMQRGRPADGLPHLKRALDANPGCGPYWLDYIEALHLAGQASAARQTLQDARLRGLQGAETDALEARLAAPAAATPPALTGNAPTDISPHDRKRLDQALTLHRSGHVAQALDLYRSLLASCPDHPDLHQFLGTAECQTGSLERGIESLRRALRFAPDRPEIHLNLGIALQQAGQDREALASFDAAIRLAPKNRAAHLGRGHLLADMRRHAEARAAYEQAIHLDPALPDAHIALGNLLEETGHTPEATTCFQRALALDPAHADARWNLAHLELRSGDYRKGWPLYEVRHDRRQSKGRRPAMEFNVPRWSGDQPLAGKAILLHAEQGIGDTLQFCRYARLVAASGAKVLLAVPPPLVRLMASLDSIDMLLSDGDALPRFDLHCPLMSLPLAFRTTLDTIPAEVPYLKSPPLLATKWQNRIGNHDRLRVGLAWSSGFHPSQPELWKDHARRNVPPALLTPLLQLPGIEFHSLQKTDHNAPTSATEWAAPAVIDHADEFTDFAETAALIEQLDLVISVDTAVAHLAGALGKPVWIMLRSDACWRWLRDRPDSPWYPTARLFRQPRLDDWPTVVQNIRTALQHLRPIPRH